MTKFVQTIEFKTSQLDEFNRTLDRWLTATEGTRSATHSMETRDRDNPDTYLQIVEFPSYEQAVANSALPETTGFAETLAALCDEPAVFRNLDLVREDDMGTPDASLLVKNFDSADETREFESGSGRLEVVQAPSGAVGRAVFEPGWRWSTHVKPIAGTDSCQVSHIGYCISGRMHIRMDDGTECEVGPGDFMQCPPGHDAWTVGEEACVLVDWAAAAEYARRR
ncbi:cupin domain-containing protein [Nocardia nova]|jgi:quercetin dioxygenase-like cupin family protein|uniref:cupin domain-containing protein n=1 Tax=Nocardia nova TaxID=37330 RepID=UPI001E379F68|nr:cupin domain-containing protein [Nocardia nova]